MKRKIWAMALAVTMTLLSACGKEDGTNASEQNNNNPSGDNGSGWVANFPEKKVQEIVAHYDGLNDEVKIKFFWSGDRLSKMSFMNTNGIAINSMYFYYDDQGRIARTAQQMHENHEIKDAFTYSYDSQGRLVKQEMMLTYVSSREWNNGEEVEHTVTLPTTFTFTYANGHLSKIHCKRVFIEEDYDDDGPVFEQVTEEYDYNYTWTGNNPTTVQALEDDMSLVFHYQYDNKKNPLNFPLGFERFNPYGALPEYLYVVSGDYSYISSIFLIMSMGENNMTGGTLNDEGENMSLGNFVYTYGEDGYPTSMTENFMGNSASFTFVY